MGNIGGNRSPEMMAIFVDIAARAARASKPIGILTPVEEDAQRFLEIGYSYVALGSDAGLRRVAAEQLRGRFPG